MILDYLIKGGILMIPLGICSVIALAVILERFFFLRRSKIMPKTFLIRIEDFIKNNHLDDAIALASEDGSSFANIIRGAIENKGKDRVVLKERIEEIGKQETARLEKRVGILTVIAGVAPLLGLLGTVFGMIDVFMKIEVAGSTDIKFLAGGIYVALITTAAGLTIAIPTFLAAKYFEGIIERLVIEMEEKSLHIIDLLVEE